MEDDSFFEPREMGIPEEMRKKYTKLVDEDKFSPFYGRSLKEVFMISLALGYKNQKRAKLDKRRADIRFESFSKEEKWIIIAISIKELGGIGELVKQETQRQVWQIAEEYAKGGFDILYQLVYSEGQSELAIKFLESELRDVSESLKLERKTSL